MKVLLVANKYEIGGAPRAMYEMVYNLKNNHNVEFTLLVNKEGNITKFCNDNNIDYIITGHETFVISKGSSKIRKFVKGLLRPYQKHKSNKVNKVALEIASNKIDFTKFDLIHTNSNRDILGALINEKFNLPHVWHLREFGKEDYDCVFLIKNAIDFMNKNTTKFITISKAVNKAWYEKGLRKDKLTQVYDGIDMSKMKSDDLRKNLCDSTLNGVFVGTVCPTKGQIYAIKALSKLEKDELKRIKIDFYGDGPIEYVSSLKRLAQSLGVEKNINFCGHNDNIGEIIQNYSFATVCSKSEAFGRITPEYMAAGAIVIASNTGANPELVQDNETGFLYEYGNDEDFALKIKKLMKMSSEQKLNMSFKAEEYVRETYTATNNAQNVYNLYKKLLRE